MDLEVDIKEEPIWLEGRANTSLENFEFVLDTIAVKQDTRSELTEQGPTQENTFKEKSELLSKMIHLKQETKSELTEPVLTQGNAFEPSAGIKEEISIEEHQLLPDIKEEDRVRDDGHCMDEESCDKATNAVDDNHLPAGILRLTVEINMTSADNGTPIPPNEMQQAPRFPLGRPNKPVSFKKNPICCGQLQRSILFSNRDEVMCMRNYLNMADCICLQFGALSYFSVIK